MAILNSAKYLLTLKGAILLYTLVASPPSYATKYEVTFNVLMGAYLDETPIKKSSIKNDQDQLILREGSVLLSVNEKVTFQEILTDIMNSFSTLLKSDSLKFWGVDRSKVDLKGFRVPQKGPILEICDTKKNYKKVSTVTMQEIEKTIDFFFLSKASDYQLRLYLDLFFETKRG
jgi:hypothetical protein